MNSLSKILGLVGKTGFNNIQNVLAKSTHAPANPPRRLFDSTNESELQDTNITPTSSQPTGEETKADRYTKEDENGNTFVYEKNEDGNYFINRDESIKQTLEKKGVMIDENGAYYITVVDWNTGEAPKEDMYANNCLSRIVANYRPSFMDVWGEAMDTIMEINPQIYSSGRGKMFDDQKYNTLIYPGDKMFIPEDWFSDTIFDIDEAVNQEKYENDPDTIVQQAIQNNDDGTHIITTTHNNGNYDVITYDENDTEISAKYYDKDGKLTSERKKTVDTEEETVTETRFYNEQDEVYKIVKKTCNKTDHTYEIATFEDGKKITFERYDSNDNLISKRTDLGHGKGYEDEKYEDNKCIERKYYDDDSKLLSRDEIEYQEDGSYIVKTYDNLDNPVIAKQYLQNDFLERELEILYNNESKCTGYKETVHNKDGSYSVIMYDEEHKVVSKQKYDKYGNEVHDV